MPILLRLFCRSPAWNRGAAHQCGRAQGCSLFTHMTDLPVVSRHRPAPFYAEGLRDPHRKGTSFVARLGLSSRSSSSGALGVNWTIFMENLWCGWGRV